MQAPGFYSFLLSQIFGFFIFILGFVLLTRPSYYRKLFEDFFKSLQPNRFIIFICSLFNLFLGIIMVDTHNLWVFKPSVYITILSWLMFVASLAWLCMPERMFHLWKKIWTGSGYYWMDVFLIIFGFMMISVGFGSYLLGGNFILLRFL